MNRITQISNFNYSSRNGQPVKYLVIHFTGNTTDTALNNASYFGRANRNASAHFFVDDNNIVQVVHKHNASWHCGDGNGMNGITNQNSIGIEMCATNSDVSQLTENNTLILVKELMAEYGISEDRVVRHFDASGKLCPSPWVADGWNRWHRFKSLLSQAGYNPPVPDAVVENKPSGLQFKNESGYAIVVVDRLNVRSAPNTNSEVVAGYNRGEQFNYNGVWYDNSYVWVEYVSYSGLKRYVAVKDVKSNVRFANCY